MNNYEKRTLVKKTAIINSAITLFGANGFTRVSIKDIASAAQVSQVSIYNYFGNKEALVEECANYIMKDTINLAIQILDSEGDFIEKIKRALMLCDNQINISLSQYLSKKASEDKQFVGLIVKNINHLKKDIYMKFINRGKQEGVINSSISNETIELFIESVNNLGFSVNEEDLKSRQFEIVQLFLYGLIGT